MSTLIAPAHACGLGIMAADLAAHCEPITHVVAVESMPSAPRVVWPTRVSVEVVQRGSQPKNVHGSTVVFIESSLDVDISGFERRVFVPMWENPATGTEAAIATDIIAVTKHAHRVLVELGTASDYLPWPVELKPMRSIREVKTLLHVAGSFGHEYRKGTPEAVAIWKASGLGFDGYRLVVRCWRQPPADLIHLADGVPGLDILHGFVNDKDELFSEGDALLFTSRCEGHALVPLEAMATGMPCFATNAWPMNEYENDARFLLPIGSINRIGTGSDYAMVDTDRAGDMLCQMLNTSSEWAQAASIHAYKMASRFSWETLGSAWSEVCR